MTKQSLYFDWLTYNWLQENIFLLGFIILFSVAILLLFTLLLGFDMTAMVLILNGPNLNILGRRPIGHYGTMTLEQINERISEHASKLELEVTFYQSNHEGNLVDHIQEHWGNYEGIIINPGALTYYGYSLKDALIDTNVPIIEVHLSNIH